VSRVGVEYRHGTSPEALADLRDGCAAAVITDPPYGMAYVSSRTKHRPTVHAIAGDASFDPDWHVAWLREAFRVTASGGALYAFIDDQHLGDMRACVAAAGWKVKRSLVWVKDGWTVGDLAGDYGHQTEFIVFAHKGRHLLAGGRESNVLRFPRVPPGELEHTAEKPVGLLRYLVRKSVPRGALVVDPFAGIASCGVAAVAEGCGYIGVESDSRWWPVGDRRIAEAQHIPHEAVEQASLFTGGAA